MKTKKKSLAFFICFVGILMNNAYAQEGKPPVLVELFTSEGCNSCPPAEKLLNELSDYDNIVALSYHVTYWDYLGWKDKFATKWGTDRQKRYARWMKSRTIFTPQIIVDGQHSEVGSNRSKINQLIMLRQRETKRAAITIQPAKNNQYLITIDKGSLQGKTGDAELHAVYYLKDVGQKITAGENRGKDALHKNVATKREVIGKWKGKGKSDYRVTKPDNDNLAGIAVFAQLRGSGAVIGSQKLNF